MDLWLILLGMDQLRASSLMHWLNYILIKYIYHEISHEQNYTKVNENTTQTTVYAYTQS